MQSLLVMSIARTNVAVLQLAKPEQSKRLPMSFSICSKLLSDLPWQVAQRARTTALHPSLSACNGLDSQDGTSHVQWYNANTLVGWKGDPKLCVKTPPPLPNLLISALLSACWIKIHEIRAYLHDKSPFPDLYLSFCNVLVKSPIVQPLIGTSRSDGLKDVVIVLCL